MSSQLSSFDPETTRIKFLNVTDDEEHGFLSDDNVSECVLHSPRLNQFRVPDKSILSVFYSPPTLRKQIALLETSDMEFDSALESLKSPLAFRVRHKTKGWVEKTYLEVSDCGTHIVQSKHMPKSAAFADVCLADVLAIIHGPRTSGFELYDWASGRPWLCFTLIAGNRTIELEYRGPGSEFRSWFTALMVILPLAKQNKMSRGQVNWSIALLKSVQIAVQMDIGVANVWDLLVADARKQVAEDKLEQN